MDSTAIIGAFGSAITALAAAIGALWYKLNRTEKECREDRLLLWREVIRQNSNTCSKNCANRRPISMPASTSEG